LLLFSLVLFQWLLVKALRRFSLRLSVMSTKCVTTPHPSSTFSLALLCFFASLLL
jgi:hypothetical protein